MRYDDEDPNQFDYGGNPATSPVQLGSFGVPINSNQPAGTQDLSYWQSRGWTPEEIFDPNGQLRAGWSRTGNGYEYAGPSQSIAPPSPAPTGGTPPGGVPTTYGGGGGGGKFDYGRPDTLGFSPYREMSPFNYSGGKFSYDPYVASNRDDLYSDQQNPGFVKSQERLRKMIEAGAAYKGVLRSGNTFNELGSILGNNEEQQFKAFDDRRFRNWSGNRENAADAWSRNLGAEQWSYGQQASDNQNFNNYRFNTEKANYDDLLSRWGELVRSTTSLARPV